MKNLKVKIKYLILFIMIALFFYTLTVENSSSLKSVLFLFSQLGIIFTLPFTIRKKIGYFAVPLTMFVFCQWGSYEDGNFESLVFLFFMGIFYGAPLSILYIILTKNSIIFNVLERTQFLKENNLVFSTNSNLAYSVNYIICILLGYYFWLYLIPKFYYFIIKKNRVKEIKLKLFYYLKKLKNLKNLLHLIYFFTLAFHFYFAMPRNGEGFFIYSIKKEGIFISCEACLLIVALMIAALPTKKLKRIFYLAVSIYLISVISPDKATSLGHPVAFGALSLGLLCGFPFSIPLIYLLKFLLNAHNFKLLGVSFTIYDYVPAQVINFACIGLGYFFWFVIIPNLINFIKNKYLKT